MDSNDKTKNILSSQERGKLIEITAIVHQVVKDISETKSRSKWETILRHPFILLLLGSIISGILIFEYQSCYTRSSERIKEKYNLMRETSLYIGTVLSLSDNVIYLHRKPITGVAQIVASNKSFNEAINKYNSNYLRVDFKLKIVFGDKNINKQWELIHKETEELVLLLDLLGEFETNNQTLEHSKRIAECRLKCNEIKTNLDQLSTFMDNAIK